ncbi:hypothetical protein SARC_06467 [Sphaeroforma arctica JP610]|uniref:Uncharacterized protein n=1 Tax=Sphaeroforma arctica JP610 TaxID=667725 RepID=A0A0L0FX22_9EUKA|nr:hypothetical protein SARC_06467 [Sphaeroforma arctica JP610]KNC81184.1 hypothetical protein SARC_06467 [Sphaeroforma arctica JP610]|eukprot:XP_014155086.1 hypothetical protein SARC_06467 [Sphaeroforma arctica JP610]
MGESSVSDITEVPGVSHSRRKIRVKSNHEQQSSSGRHSGGTNGDLGSPAGDHNTNSCHTSSYCHDEDNVDHVSAPTIVTHSSAGDTMGSSDTKETSRRSRKVVNTSASHERGLDVKQEVKGNSRSRGTDNSVVYGGDYKAKESGRSPLSGTRNSTGKHSLSAADMNGLLDEEFVEYVVKGANAGFIDFSLVELLVSKQLGNTQKDLEKLNCVQEQKERFDAEKKKQQRTKKYKVKTPKGGDGVARQYELLNPHALDDTASIDTSTPALHASSTGVTAFGRSLGDKEGMTFEEMTAALANAKVSTVQQTR